jgi:uncharacterized protein (TIGR00255 family)
MRSMTGYGAGSAEVPTARVTVEVRSVNQRFLDVKVSAPREYAAWEREVRDRVRAVAQRGRVEITVARTPVARRRRYAVAVRTELARAYVRAARELARTVDLESRLVMTDLLRLPDLFEVSEHPPDVRAELAAVRRALARALRVFDAERRREGRDLRRDMQRRVGAVQRAAARIGRRIPHAVAALYRQTKERLARFPNGGELDPGRVAQEAATLAERSDITEEMVRLESHLRALRMALRRSGPTGKRIEFLLQEMHRELNTTGAKSGDLAIGALVLEAKAEVEKLREQVQNVE